MQEFVAGVSHHERKTFFETQAYNRARRKSLAMKNQTLSLSLYRD